MSTQQPNHPMDREILQRVLEVSRLMAETRLLTPLLDRVMDEAVNLVGAERGYLVLVRGDGSNEIRVRRGKPSETGPLTTDEISDSIVDQVVRTRRPLIVHDALTDPKFSNAQSIINLRLRSVMCAPLVSRATLIGALYVENRSISGRFKEGDLPPLMLFATQAAVAIENAALNEDLEHRVAERTHELQAALTQLESSWMNMVETNRLQTELLSNVAHDLRSPLTIVTGALTAMDGGMLGTTTPEQKEWLAKSIEAINHVLNLTNDLFDLTKLEQGGLALYPQAVDPAEFLRSIYKIGLGLPWPTDVKLLIDLPAHLPMMAFDPIRIRQVMLNLLSNALKFTYRGTVTIRARPMTDRGEIWIGVTDTGEGILPEKVDRLFKRFQQVDDNVERRQKGTGLGLAISRQLVEMHRGRIWAESQPGRGTSFIFALPVTT